MRIIQYLFGIISSTVFSFTPLTWTMVNVNQGTLQGDAHVLQMPDRRVFLIDVCGNNDALISFLVKERIRHIDKVLISHMHKDHYAGLENILRKGISIGEVVRTIPSEKMCAVEAPWGCDWKDVQNFERVLKTAKVPVRDYKPGEILYEEGITKMEVIAAFPSDKTPIGNVDVNDTSAIIRLSHGINTVLFTGDLNAGIGKWLATNSKNLKADILKVPHHGTDSAAPNEFFDAVDAKFALVPSPAALWLSDRSARIRNYLEKNNTKIFVNGMSGDVKVTLTPRALAIDPEHSRPQKSVYYMKKLSE